MNDRATSFQGRPLPTFPIPPGSPPIVRIDADASWQAVGCSTGPVSLLVDNVSPTRLIVLALDSPNLVDHHPAAHRAHRIDLSAHVLLPGLVNAHTHLDLTHLGPMHWDPTRTFTEWVAHIRAGRRTEPGAIAHAVRWGAELAIAGGTVAVGDIAGAVRARVSMSAAEGLAPSGLHGVSFLEFFAVGPRAGESLTPVEEMMRHRDPGLVEGRLRLGIQPHATNTVEPGAYRTAIDLARRAGVGVSTHLAETPEEREFIARATGPQRALLEQVGAWDDALLSVFGLGHHPAVHLEPVLRQAADAGRPFLVAHVNDATDEAIEVLARTGTRVAYCPRASAYFGAERHFGPHRYRDMLDAGVPVCLGTDSVVNITDGTLGLDASATPTGRLSILDEMRLLWRRDRTPPETLIRMATTNAVRALHSPWLGDHHVAFDLGRAPDGADSSEGATPLAILAALSRPGTAGPAAVRSVLERTDPPISVLTRILPVWQQ